MDIESGTPFVIYAWGDKFDGNNLNEGHFDLKRSSKRIHANELLNDQENRAKMSRILSI